MSEQVVRAFIAVQIPEDVSEAVWEVQDRLQHLPPMHNLRWVEPEDAHITLKFLGDTPIPQLPSIVDALDAVAGRWEPFTVKLGRLGAFPNVHRPNVLWLGVEEGEKPFVHLYNAVEVALKKVGIRPERREYTPHLTIARVPSAFTQTQRREVGDLIGPTSLPEVPAFTVRAIALMRSILSPEGSHYIRLGNSVFGEAPPLEEDEWEDIP